MILEINLSDETHHPREYLAAQFFTQYLKYAVATNDWRGIKTLSDGITPVT
jgi:hypothetical protein